MTNRILYYCSDDTDDHILTALRHELREYDIIKWPSTDNLSEITTVIVWQPPAKFFHGLVNLQHVLSVSAGVDHLLNQPGFPKNAELVRLTDAGMAQPMAEYILYGVLHAQRKMNALAQAQRQQLWRHDVKQHPADQFRVGILGAGELGLAAARRLRDNNYPVSCWSRSEKDLSGIQHYAGTAGLNEMLPGVQALVCLLPLTNETRCIINSSLLSRLPANAFIINPGRGDHVDEKALLAALDSNHISGALLDVFTEEPLPSSNLLWIHPNVIVTPHIAAEIAIPAAVEQIAQSLSALKKGQKPAGLVNRNQGY